MVLSAFLLFVSYSRSIGFNDAYSSSTYASGNGITETQYAPTNALTSGSDYWLSSSKFVSWTGEVDAFVACNGIRIVWSHAPSQIRILARSNDSETEDASGWIDIDTEAISSTINFRSTISGSAFTLVMKNSKDKDLIGISHVSLISEADQTALIISGASNAEEQCFSVANGMSDKTGSIVTLESCASTIASGDSRSTFTFMRDGKIRSSGDKCIIVSNRDRNLELGTCDDTSDGRNVWMLTSDARMESSIGGCVYLPIKSTIQNSNIALSATSASAEYPTDYILDGRKDTFWKSSSNVTPQSLSFEFESEVRIQSVSIEWQNVAKTFTVQIASNDGQWETLYFVDGNIETKSLLSGQTGLAKRMRILMISNVNKDDLYAIKEVKFEQALSYLAIKDCDEASMSGDGSDMIFVQPITKMANSASDFKSVVSLYESTISELGSYVSEIISLRGTCSKTSFLSTHTKTRELVQMQNIRGSQNVLKDMNQTGYDRFSRITDIASSIIDSFEA